MQKVGNSAKAWLAGLSVAFSFTYAPIALAAPVTVVAEDFQDATAYMANWSTTGFANRDETLGYESSASLKVASASEGGGFGSLIYKQSLTLQGSVEYTLTFAAIDLFSTFSVSLGGVTLQGQLTGTGGANDEWNLYSYTFLGSDITGTEALAFSFTDVPFDFAAIDDILLTAPEGTTNPPGGTVPEPGSLALVGVALTAVAIAGRRRVRGGSKGA